MQLSFDITHRIFCNANDFKPELNRLPDFAPVDELIKETGRWYSELKDEDEDYAKSIRLKIWRLRATVIFTLMHFNNKELKLIEQLGSLRNEIVYIPFLSERMEKLEKIIQFLIDNPENPKRKKIFELIKEGKSGGRGLGLVTSLCRGKTPGWPTGILNEIKNIAPRCEFITSRRILKYRTFQQIILPSSGRLSPLLYDLYYCCRCSKLNVIVYKREGAKAPAKLTLPKGALIKLTAPKIPNQLQQDKKKTEESIIDEWVQRKFWETIRNSSIRESAISHHDRDKQFLITARIVILEDNKKVFLQDDVRVIEISDLIEGRASIEDYGKKFPRKSVDQLEEGDLIVLRTSGSGDYLIDVADSLMKADGKSKLRSTALDWKSLLKKTLEEYGSDKIGELLAEKGFNLTNYRYIWIWTTNIITRPKSSNLFTCLIQILYDLGYKLDSDDPVTAASTRWWKMKDIIKYHMIAGRKIRDSLLSRLRDLIEKGVTITDSYSLTLPEAGGGEMSVFRIADIDTEPIEIPYTQAGIIRELED